VIDLEPIAATEREPLALQRCAIGQRDRLGVGFETAVGHIEPGWFRRRGRGEQDSLEARGANLGVPRVEVRNREVAVAVFQRLDSRLVGETLDFYSCWNFKSASLL
jgi:hypothetical protein